MTEAEEQVQYVAFPETVVSNVIGILDALRVLPEGATVSSVSQLSLFLKTRGIRTEIKQVPEEEK